MARRRRSNTPNALVAAAVNIKLDQPKAAAKHASKRQDWQKEAWAYFDEVPEIKESIRYRGNQLAKVRLFVAVEDPDDPGGLPIPVEADESGVPAGVAAAAMTELDRLRSRSGGQAQIMRELDMNLEIAGECYLVGYGQRTTEVEQRDGTTETVDVPEDWCIKSVTEVKVQGSGRSTKYVILDGPDDIKGKPLDLDLDTILRIWTRHPQWGNLPDSAMRALLGECRTLQVLTQQVLAEANSRQSAGALTVPNELSFGPADPTDPADGGADSSGDPFEDELMLALTEPIADPSSAASVMPMVIRGPAEYLKDDVLRRIDFSRDTSEALDKRIDARIARIARGLNLPVEKIMGLQQTTFANAAQVDEDEYNDYLRPSVNTATDALTFAFLTPQLMENQSVPGEWKDGRLFIAADHSALIRQPDPEANADQAFANFAIGFAAYRKAKGFSEDDAPDEVETLIMAGLRRGILTADLTHALLNLLGVEIELPQAEIDNAEAADEEDELVAALRAAVTDGDADPAVVEAVIATLATRAAQPVTAVRQPPLALTAAPSDNPTGRALVEIDRDLRTRLTIAASDAMGRALERAGNRLRSKANDDMKALLRTVPPAQSFAHLGPVLVAQALGDDDPLAGAWDDLEGQFMTWGANAQQDAMDTAAKVASGFTTAERSALGLRQAEDLAEAWAWMKESLTALAETEMFGGAAVAVLGEFDPTLKVPTGLLRNAIARAGGHSGLDPTDVGAYVTLLDGGQTPAGGIGTGKLMTEFLRDHDAGVEAYRWQYGPAHRDRPFEPHRGLDGVVFQNFDDAVLANSHSFPPYDFYLPGDHSGCICDFEPIIVPAEDVQ